MSDMGRHNLLNGHRGEDGAATPSVIAPKLAPFTISPALQVQRLAPMPPPAPETVTPPPADEADTPASARSLRDYPWPLLVIAAPAAVAIWSGWVGLGEMCGFGPIRPLPGIAPAVVINTAITLPVGVEAYGAYALAVWLGGKKISGKTRNWARVSAVGALALGCLGQVAFHLLSAARWTQAPWPVVTIVSCLPVVSLALAAALAHMIRADVRSDTEADTAATEDVLEPDVDSDTEDVIDDADERHDSDESGDTDDDETDRDERHDPDPDSDTKEPAKRPRASAASDKVSAILRRSKRLRDLLASDSAADRKAAKEQLAEKAGVTVRTVERALSELASATAPGPAGPS